MWFFYSIHSHWHLVSSYNRTCTNGHLSTMATLLCPGGQSIGWLLFNLSTTATATKALPQLPKYPLDNGQFFSDWRKVTTFDPFGAALMINRSNCIHLFKFFLCILGHILYYWIISTGYSKHEFGTINMFYASKTTCHITPPPPHHGHFPLSPRFPFDCTCISLSFSVIFFLLASEQPALIVSQPVVAWRSVSTVFE